MGLLRKHPAMPEQFSEQSCAWLRENREGVKDGKVWICRAKYTRLLRCFLSEKKKLNLVCVKSAQEGSSKGHKAWENRARPGSSLSQVFRKQQHKLLKD